MFSNKIKIDDALYDKIKEACDSLGVSVEEFACKVLEAEADKVLNSNNSSSDISQSEIDNISKKLKGLGYLD